eukprot:2797643-Alexandrium_andersonii.AAC.1
MLLRSRPLALFRALHRITVMPLTTLIIVAWARARERARSKARTLRPSPGVHAISHLVRRMPRMRHLARRAVPLG